MLRHARYARAPETLGKTRNRSVARFLSHPEAMNLTPVESRVTPAYPAHRRQSSGLGDWLRRLALAGLLSGAAAFGGCYGSTPEGEETGASPEPFSTEIIASSVMVLPPPTVEPEPMGGDVAGPSFRCEAPDTSWVEQAPAWVFGSLCGEETAWAHVDITVGGEHDLTLQNGPAFVDLIDGEGTLVGTVTPEEPFAMRDLEPGRVTLAATPADSEQPNGWFEISLTLSSNL